jgi:copper chaperone
MSLKIKVPTIACEGCAEIIVAEIAKQIPQAKVKVDVVTKIVEVETDTSEDLIKAAISAVGHEIA